MHNIKTQYQEKTIKLNEYLGLPHTMKSTIKKMFHKYKRRQVLFFNKKIIVTMIFIINKKIPEDNAAEPTEFWKTEMWGP